jgi:hypothetical protein
MNLGAFLHNILSGVGHFAGNLEQNVQQPSRVLNTLLGGNSMTSPSAMSNYQHLTPQQQAAFTPIHPGGGAPHPTMQQIYALSGQAAPSHPLAALSFGGVPVWHVNNPNIIQGASPNQLQGSFGGGLQATGMPQLAGQAPQGAYMNRMFQNFNGPETY